MSTTEEQQQQQQQHPRQHFALVEKDGCKPLRVSLSQSASGLEHEGTTDDERVVRAELEQIYQTYADLYPNPRLIEEKRQEETLLQAARAASAFQREAAGETKKKPRRGFFASLFGGREPEEESNGSRSNSSNNNNNQRDNEKLAEQLRYVDTPNEHDDGSLCGTMQSLDVACIPPEVYTVARSHLVSSRRAKDHPNALRWGPESRSLLAKLQHRQQQQQQQQQSREDSVIFVVAGLGAIAEFGGEPGHGSSSSSRVLHTSDREDLLAYAEQIREPAGFDPSAARGTVLSQNCIAVSWGFQDGIAVVYRRRVLLSGNNGDENENETATEEWEAVRWLGPSGPVLDHMTGTGLDFFHDDADQPGSPLLAVSDCVALHAEAPVAGAVAVLVVARLGGYIELVPMPNDLWAGPVLERDASAARKEQKAPRQRQPHYATGRAIGSPPTTLALTTFDYHLDVQTMEVHRTGVDGETQWNNELYPDGPPAEFLLVASGMSADGGFGETLTFWSVSTLFASAPEGPDGESGHRDSRFEVHSSLLEAIWTGAGAPVSIFATQGIMRRWRTPRHVELKDPSTGERGSPGGGGAGDDDGSPPAPALAPVTTLSTPAPIVCGRFSGSDGPSGPFLSLLDWNGAAQVFDCSVVARLAAQDLTEEEYERYRSLRPGAEQDGQREDEQQQQQQQQQQEPFLLVSSVVDRSQVAAALQKVARAPAVSNLHWLESSGLGTDGYNLPTIVFLLGHSRRLAVVTFDLGGDDRGQLRQTPGSSVSSVPLPSSGAAMETIGDNTLSFVSLRRGRSKSSPRTPALLFHYFVMEQLQPVAIVETLARESKLREAIESAGKLSKYEQNELSSVVVDCHRRLWETGRDAESLRATGDESYIVREALSICRSSNANEDPGFSLEDLRLVLKLALETTTALGENNKQKEMARDYFVRLGTYELLCGHYGSKPSLGRFRAEFLGVDLAELSHQLASRGDVSALSVLLFRHRSKVRHGLLGILGSLPLALHPSSFCHLLPVIRRGQVSDLFLDPAGRDAPELPWSHMPQFIRERHQVSIVSDRFDEIAVLEHNKGPPGGEADSEEFFSDALLADWFVERAKEMQAFVGDVDEVVRMSQFGARCIDPKTDSSSVQELHVMCRTALSLQRMLLDQAVSIDGDGIDTDDLMGMDLVDLLDLVLDSGIQSSEVQYRFHEYVQPIVMEMSHSSSRDGLDEALSAYCLREAKKCSGLHIAGAKHALALAVAIAENSKASLDQKNRLIKNEQILIQMVLATTKEISRFLSDTDASINEKRELIETIWSLYETLPAHLATPESGNETKLNSFYQDMVGVDILSRWPGCKSFEFFTTRQSEMRQEGSKAEEEKLVVVGLCKSFTASLSMVVNPEDEVSLLQDLLCDIGNLQKEVFGNASDLSTMVCNCLVPAFLEKGQFKLVASYLESDDTVVDRQQVEDYIVAYLDETMFSGGDDGSRISNAITCQDVLETVLPEIKPLCQANRHYLDASHFVSTVLLEDKPHKRLKPSDFKEMPALDAVETVLRESPECIACRCSQWTDSDYARKANKHLREAESSIGVTVEEQEIEELPELPGGAVFHLATVLGLESSVSAVAVKSRVIYYALMCGFHGAGASIARTLIDSEFGSGENRVLDSVKLDAIVDVVSNENYLDQNTKKELCESVLRRFKSEITIRNSESFNTILRVSSNLDHITSRFELEVSDLPPVRKDCLLSRPIARLPVHIFHEYNRDIICLFRDLSNQASQGLMHDSLMEALSRFIFYWCIHDSKTTKRYIDLRYKADAEENLMVGCGMILQIPSNATATNCVNELREIAVAQAASVATEERFESTHAIILPNPDIMKHLIDRGFSENGARRAVIMTGNAGSNEALAWGVQHTMDADFNDPLVMLKYSNREYIDEGFIQLLQKNLIQISDILKNPTQRSTLLQMVGNHFPKKYEKSDLPISSDAKTKVQPTKSELKTSQKLTLRPIRRKAKGKVQKIDPEQSSSNEILDENGSTPTEVNVAVKQKQKPLPPPRRNIVDKSISTATERNQVTQGKEQPRPPPRHKAINENAPTRNEVNQAVEQKQELQPPPKRVTAEENDSTPTGINQAFQQKQRPPPPAKRIAPEENDSTPTEITPILQQNQQPMSQSQPVTLQEKDSTSTEISQAVQQPRRPPRPVALEENNSTPTNISPAVQQPRPPPRPVTLDENDSTPTEISQVIQKKQRPRPPPPRVSSRAGIEPMTKSVKQVSKSKVAGDKTPDDDKNFDPQSFTKVALKPTIDREALRKKAKEALKKLQGNQSATENGVECSAANAGLSSKTKTASDVLKATAQKRNKMGSQIVNGDGSTTGKEVKNRVSKIGTVTGMTHNRREDLLKRGQLAREREQTATMKEQTNASTAEDGVKSSISNNLVTKIATKTAMDRREALLKKAQEALSRRRNPTTNSSDSRTRLIQEGKELRLQTKPSRPTAPNRTGPVTRSRPNTKFASSLPSSSKSTASSQVRKTILEPKLAPMSISTSEKPSQLENPSPIGTTNGGNTGEPTTNDGNESEDSGWDFDDFDDF